MDEPAPMNPYMKESLIGIAAACFSVVFIVAMMEGGGGTAFGDALLLLLFGFVSPFLFLPALPWLVLVFAAAGFLVYRQFQYVPVVFVRYLIGAEVILWQLLGIWMFANFAQA